MAAREFRVCDDPTPEEVEAARKMIGEMSKADQKKGLANMAYWLRNAPSNEGTKGVRGALRQEWFVQYMVMKTREKNGKAETTARRKHTLANQKTQDIRWLSKFSLQKELGETKIEAWINSGKLPTRPDPVTGQDTEWMKEYKVVFEGGQLSETSAKEMMLTVTDEAKPEAVEEILATLGSLEGGASAAGSNDPAPLVNIKKEPEEEVIIKNPSQDLQRVQAQIIELKSMRCQAESIKYADNLMKDMDKAVVNMKRTTKALEALVVKSSEKPDEKAAQKLKDAMATNDAAYKEILEWAQKFGISALLKGKKKRKVA